MKSNIRIGLCGWNADSTTLDLINQFQIIGVEIAFLIINPEKRDRLKDIKRTTRVIEQGAVIDVILGKSANIEWRIHGSELEAYSAHIPSLLRAQERWLQGDWNVDDRLFVTHRAINYMNSLLKEGEVSAVIHCTGSPHHFYNLVLNIVGDRQSVPSFYLYYSFVTNRFSIVCGLKKEFHQLSSALQKEQPSSNESYRGLIKSITTQRDTRHSSQLAFYQLSARYALLYVFAVFPRQLAHVFYRDVILQSSGVFLRDDRGQVRAFINSFIELVKDFFRISFFKAYYKKRCSSELKSKSYIIYASYQPEASSHPDGGEFPDARYVAADLMKSGVNVYYKEHPGTFLYHCVLYPNQFSKHRSYKYYEDLLSMGVKFLDVNMPNRDIFETCPTIVSNAGTILLESALNNVNAYAVGYPWYGFLEGISQYRFGDKRWMEIDASSSNEERSNTILASFLDIDASSFTNVFGVGIQVVDECTPGEISRLAAAIREVIVARQESNF